MDPIMRAKFMLRTNKNALEDVARLTGLDLKVLKKLAEDPRLFKTADFNTINSLNDLYFKTALSDKEMVSLAIKMRDLLKESDDSRLQDLAKKIENNPSIIARLILE